MVAASKKKWDIVNLLLRRGANATLLDDVCFKLQLKEINFTHKTNTTNNEITVATKCITLRSSKWCT
jgi:hypothetical protein